MTQAIKLLGRIPYVIDGGPANHLVVNPAPSVSAYAVPIVLAIKVQFVNTGATDINVSGLGAIPLLRTTLAPLSAGDLPAGGIVLVEYDGAQFQLLSVPGSLTFPLPQQLWHYGVDTSATPNQIVVSTDSVGAAWPTGLPVAIKVANANTGATTIALNGMATVAATLGAGLALVPNDIIAGGISLFIFDGTEAQLINPGAAIGGSPGGGDITVPNRPYWLAVSSIVISTPPGSGNNVGDTYLIPTGATGAWAGLAGRLAQWTLSGWVFRAYPAGSVIGASDTLRFYENVGSNIWIEIQMLTMGKLFYYGQL